MSLQSIAIRANKLQFTHLFGFGEIDSGMYIYVQVLYMHINFVILKAAVVSSSTCFPPDSVLSPVLVARMTVMDHANQVSMGRHIAIVDI